MHLHSARVRRRAGNLAWTVVSGVCASGVALVLLLIMGYIVIQGVGALSWSFLTHLPHPVGVAGGGMANGIVGTLIIVGIAAVLAFPVGVMVGVYLGVYGHGRMASCRVATNCETQLVQKSVIYDSANLRTCR